MKKKMFLNAFVQHFPMLEKSDFKAIEVSIPQHQRQAAAECHMFTN